MLCDPDKTSRCRSNSFRSILYHLPCLILTNPYATKTCSHKIVNLTIFSFEFRIKLFFPFQIIKGFVEKFFDHESDFLPLLTHTHTYTHTLSLFLSLSKNIHTQANHSHAKKLYINIFFFNF